MAENKNTYSSDNRRIAKNTLMLYFRMFITMLVGLYTSRVFLSALGFDDYGIYNVVAGVIGMMGVVTGLLSQGTMRFLTFSIGRDSLELQKKTFSALVTIHIVMSMIVVLLGETIGLWFLNKYIVFDVERRGIVNFVYQLTLIGACIGVIQVPFNTSIISKEKLNIYAYISIYDVVVKLLIVFVLFYVDYDKLKMYSMMLLLSSITTLYIYIYYCKINFDFCRYKFFFDRVLYKKMLDYVGWNSIGVVAFALKNQGLVVLLNISFGPVVNAAYAIGNTISNMVNQFISSFQTAVNPQVIKMYAVGNVDRTNELITDNAKFSSYLLLLFAVPLFIEMEDVLTLWLGEYPEYTLEFSRLVLIQLMFQAIDHPVGYGIHAVGKMKLPNLTSSFIYMLILPICYVAIKFGANPTAMCLLSICVYPLVFVCDILILRHFTRISISKFLKEVPLKTMLIIAATAILPVFIHLNMESGFVRLFAVCFASLMISSFLIYRFGLGTEAREQLLSFIKSRLQRR